jgi:maleylpyruvate isomerase
MKLYEGPRSSCSWRVRWALALKQVEYQSVVIDIASDEHLVRMAPLNTMKQVPTLELDDGRVMTESVAIIEWLDEIYPDPPLLPRDPWLRAHARELVQIVNAGTQPMQNTSVQKAVSPDPEVRRQWCQRWIERGLTAYEAHVRRSAGRFSIGDQLTMADLFAVPQVRNAERHGADLSSCTKLQQIYVTCLTTPEAVATDPARLFPG